MQVTYKENNDVAIFNGYKFRRDKSTGYYLSSKKINGKRKRLHVYVWEYFFGEIEEGFHVHHVEEDKSKNDIADLELMQGTEHIKLHANNFVKDNYDAIIENLNENARPKASEWHGSDEGKEWHKEHYENMKHKLHMEIERNCDYCNKVYIGKSSRSKFCSNKCKSAHRRESGVDDVVKQCTKCNQEYIANKYQKTKRCKPCEDKKHQASR